MFMKKNRSLNLKYAGSQIFYFAAFASMMGYASVFLLDKGCTNSQIGIALALSSIIAVILQPMLASFADNHKNIEMRNIIASIVLLVCIYPQFFIYSRKCFICLFLVVTIFSIMSSIMPLMNSLAFVFEQHGIETTMVCSWIRFCSLCNRFSCFRTCCRKFFTRYFTSILYYFYSFIICCC